MSAVIVVSASASRVNDPPSKSVAPPKLASTIFVPSEKTNFVLLSDVPKVTYQDVQPP